MAFKIDRNTSVSVGLLLAVVGPLLGLLWLGFGLRVDVQALKNDRYSLTQASEDAFREAMENPGHRVPDPRHPGSMIVVEVGRIKSAASVPAGGWSLGEEAVP